MVFCLTQFLSSQQGYSRLLVAIIGAFALFLCFAPHQSFAQSLAQVDAMRECVAQGALYGNGVGPSRLDSKCRGVVESAAVGPAKKFSSELKANFYGAASIIYVVLQPDGLSRKYEDPLVVAGKSTHLTNVTAIGVDEVHQEFVVLDAGAKSVFAFDFKILGNVGPLRTLQSKELEDANVVAVDPVGHELVVGAGALDGFGGNARILFFSRLSDKDGRRPHSHQRKFREWVLDPLGVISISDLAIVPERRELFIADSVGGQILVLDLSNQAGPRLIRTLRGDSTQLFQPKSLSYRRDTQVIQVINGDGRHLRFPVTAEGNLSPF